MSVFHRLLAAVTCLSLSGCGEDPPPSPQPEVPASATSSNKIEDTTSEPPALKQVEPEVAVSVTVIDEGIQDTADELEVQHRSLRVVISGAKTQEQFETAAKAVFEKVAEEIEQAVPDSKNKRIDLRAFDNRTDAESGDVFVLHASNIASPDQPGWDDAYLDWRWRLPEFHPSDQWLQIHADYRRLRATAKELPDARKEVCRKYNLTSEQFVELHAYLMIWHSGGRPEGELLETWKADLLAK